MINRVRALWRLLGIPINNEGERRKRNLRTLACIAAIMEVPAFIGASVYLLTPLRAFAVGCVVYAVFNAVIFYLAAVKKNRELAVKVTAVLAITACTNIALFARNGFAANWTLLFPLIVCYICGIRLGILSSCYMTLLYMALYWTPLRAIMEGVYPEVFLDRFPFLYLMAVLNTAYIDLQSCVKIS